MLQFLNNFRVISLLDIYLWLAKHSTSCYLSYREAILSSPCTSFASTKKETMWQLEPPLIPNYSCHKWLIFQDKSGLVLSPFILNSVGQSILSHKGRQALTLDCGNHWPRGPVNQKIHWPPKKPTGPPKTCNDPNVFAAGIYDFTSEVAHFCTLGLYITKNKYELTLPSEFCRFPVKNNGGIRSTKKKKPLAPRASGK